jgi:glycosyltransferase involved in cell wall biosynthesis
MSAIRQYSPEEIQKAKEEGNKLMGITEKKIRVLALCDSPTAATGFAQVSRNVLKGLAKTGKYEIDVIGINYYGDYYDRTEHPYNIYPAMPQGYADMYGRGRLVKAISGQEEAFKKGYDLVFTIQDPFVIEGLGIDFPFAEQLKVAAQLWRRSVPPEFWFNWIGYFPVDSVLKENWVTRSIALADYVIAYCDYGKKQMLKYDKKEFETFFNLGITQDDKKKRGKIISKSLADRIQVIHHGVDLDVFKPISEADKKAFRKKFFNGKIKDSTYLVINVSRNQPRKDISRTLAAFAEFKKRVPDSHLYLHCQLNDAGGSIDEMARNFDLRPGEDYTVPLDFNAGKGFPTEVVNNIYNVADLCITTTLGEGWGFITTEAMATKTPIVAPYITSIIDIFGGDQGGSNKLYNIKMIEADQDLRGIPVIAGSTSSEWICQGIDDNERIRPLTNVDDMVEKMVWAYSHRAAVSKIVERAYEWVQGISWKNIVNEWDNVFHNAYKALEEQRVIGKLIDKAGRNDPCPCGSGNKFKRCHGSDNQLAKFHDVLEEDKNVTSEDEKE